MKPRINIVSTALVVIAAVSLTAFLVGCDTARTLVTIPSADKTVPAMTFEQTGTAENPSEVTIVENPAPGFWMDAEVGNGKVDASFPCGPKSPDGKPATGRVITIKGTKSFQPPAPPSPKDNAEGNAVYIAIGCVLIGIIAAGALAKFGFVHEAFWAVAGGFACGAAVRFISNEVAMYVAGAIALLIGVLVWAWYRVRDRVPEEHGGRLKAAKK